MPAGVGEEIPDRGVGVGLVIDCPLVKNDPCPMGFDHPDDTPGIADPKAHRNGASQVACIDGKAVRALEPSVRAEAALHSPSTGIVDAHALAVSYWAECEAHEAVLLVQAEVVEVASCATGWRVVARQPDATTTPVVCGAVVNAAGLHADRLAAMAGVDIEAWGYRHHYCKGDYFGLAPGRKVGLSRLVYPLPGASGLGIHATLDLSGRVRFGPDTEYVDAPRYDVDPANAEAFARAVGAYLPGVDASWLVPDYAGVRPRRAAPGEGFRDFVVREESDRGAPAWVDCVGIESPGLTAAPAIAARVRDELRGL